MRIEQSSRSLGGTPEAVLAGHWWHSELEVVFLNLPAAQIEQVLGADSPQPFWHWHWLCSVDPPGAIAPG